MLKDEINNSPNKRYRSVKYRSISSDFSLNKIKSKVQNLPSFNLSKTPIIKKSNQKSVFRSTGDFQSFIKNPISSSLDKSYYEQSSNTKLNITKQINPQKQIDISFQKNTYLNNFQDLMDIQDPKGKYPKNSQINVKISRIKAKFKTDRITLPNIIEYQDSKFTALDLICLPIQYVEEQIYKLNLQLAELPQPFKKMRQQMHFFKQKIMSQLESYQNGFLPQIKKLRRKITLDKVYQQQQIMKCKRQVEELQQFVPQFKNKIKYEHQRQITIQTDIFETKPFELNFNQNDDQRNQRSKLSSTEYF